MGHIESVTALARLRMLAAEQRRAEARIGAAVRSAREGGMSWAQIGTALGVTKQAAQQRWGHARSPGRVQD